MASMTQDGYFEITSTTKGANSSVTIGSASTVRLEPSPPKHKTTATRDKQPQLRVVPHFTRDTLSCLVLTLSSTQQ